MAYCGMMPYMMLIAPWSVEVKWHISPARSVKVLVSQVAGFGFKSPSGYKVGCPGCPKYVWLGNINPVA